MTSEEPTWLTAEQQRVWRSLHGVLLLLPIALDRQLQQDSELSLLEYYVLAGLSEDPTGAARLSDVAFLTNAELSRVSHLAARLEKRGLLVRRPDPADGRYTNAVITEEGRDLVRRAAPGHVATVRKLIFDALGEAGVPELGRAMDRIGTALSETDVPRIPGAGRRPPPGS
ncbi:MarR family winged helix-turn-helix transcriptional regulator [Actinoplanes palleronii]|uniref:MarR family transcriptional regulator n=1 Tax=Actinoplanes palleronii TaxID=113570 RepID=A0ABQ4BGP2_9ACTN|nr:MarR family transcriptional regulator [Actinoplanes palleronii]GIE69843.1 MarR family transcriptional regulator [Actinoplanes palleronii]